MTRPARKPKRPAHEKSGPLVWRIIRSTANDNRTSIGFWLRLLGPWSLGIGLALWAYYLF